MVTRQRKWQRLQDAMGLCIICNREQKDGGVYCEVHLQKRHDRWLKKQEEAIANDPGYRARLKRCGICGETGHNRRSCKVSESA